MNDPIIKGGHAIMLRLVWPAPLGWTGGDFVMGHLTLAHFGRNLTSPKTTNLLNVGTSLTPHLPNNVLVTGVGMFGPQQDRLALLIHKSAALLKLREKLEEKAKEANLCISTAYEFTPHVTAEPWSRAPLRLPVAGIDVKLGSGVIVEL